MANLKVLRLRIKSIKSTQKITKAMQMVSASKLRHARNIMENASIYYDLILKTIGAVLNFDQDKASNLTKLILGIDNKDKNKTLAIVVTSDRGLCGGFNQSVLKKARQSIDQMKSSGKDVKIIVVGKKGSDILTNRYGSQNIIANHPTPQSKTLKTSMSDICNNILAELDADKYSEVVVYFNHFQNTASQIPQSRIVAPIAIHNDSTDTSEAPQGFEHDGYDIVDQSVRLYLTSEIHHAIFESKASEEAARMIAMDNATKNAGDMINKLTLSMNRTRQSIITKELIEIISGAEAV